MSETAGTWGTKEAAVLLFQLFQTMDLGDFHAAVFLVPAIIGLFADTEMARSIDNRLVLRNQDLRLTEMADNLFIGVPFPGHRAPFLRPIS